MTMQLPIHRPSMTVFPRSTRIESNRDQNVISVAFSSRSGCAKSARRSLSDVLPQRRLPIRARSRVGEARARLRFHSAPSRERVERLVPQLHPRRVGHDHEIVMLVVIRNRLHVTQPIVAVIRLQGPDGRHVSVGDSRQLPVAHASPAVVRDRELRLSRSTRKDLGLRQSFLRSAMHCLCSTSLASLARCPSSSRNYDGIVIGTTVAEG